MAAAARTLSSASEASSETGGMRGGMHRGSGAGGGGGAQEGCLEEELLRLTAQGQPKPGLAGSWGGLCRALPSDKTLGGPHAHSSLRCLKGDAERERSSSGQREE